MPMTGKKKNVLTGESGLVSPSFLSLDGEFNDKTARGKISFIYRSFSCQAVYITSYYGLGSGFNR